MQAVAAGHPATAAAGAEILAEGGNAADAAVAASLASCVAETVMTGLLGGGHGIYHDAGTGKTANLDCFVAVPGLGGERRDAQLLELQVPFGQELVHYAVGIASCGVPASPRVSARSGPRTAASPGRGSSSPPCDSRPKAWRCRPRKRRACRCSPR